MQVISAIDWMPHTRGVVAVAYCSPSFTSFTAAAAEDAAQQDSDSSMGWGRPSVILIWNFVDPIHPQARLEAPCDVVTMRFHPNHAHILVAGLVNGQILYYQMPSAQQQQQQASSHSGGGISGSRYPAKKDGGHKQPCYSYTVSHSVSQHLFSSTLISFLASPFLASFLLPVCFILCPTCFCVLHVLNSPTTQHVSQVSSSLEQSHKSSVMSLVWIPPTIDVNAKGKISE